jgi:hypothetical protein
MADDRIPEMLYFNPHIYWDPIGPPWEYPEGFDQTAKDQLALIRLSLHKDVLAAQAKAADAAIALVSKKKG